MQKDYKDCTKKGREKQTIKFGPDISISEFLDKMNLIKPFLNNKTDEEVERITSDWWEAIGNFPNVVWDAARTQLLKTMTSFMVTPGEFRKMCQEVKPEELGYTSTKQAYAECYLNIRQRHKVTQPRHWSHATVFIASEALRAQNYACGISEYRKFEKSYLKAIYRDLNGERLPYPPVVLPMIENKPAKSRQCGSEHLAKLRGALGRPAHA
ncbi:hypothetical protein [Piscirickettsia salmonis]|uniref:hypothetical protein n=2 Tax=Piscirickettsia salmonis TaxID=1238 RepID=UPI001E3F9619|nr:hypothetical protein [Piscirickettsia salmonis]